jgi:hypothetical protein
LQSFVPTPVSRRVDVRQAVKTIAESLSQHDKKHVVPCPLSGIRVRKRKKKQYDEAVPACMHVYFCYMAMAWHNKTEFSHNFVFDKNFLESHSDLNTFKYNLPPI